MHWHIGKRIFEEEQEGKDRAEYGDYLTKFVAEQLEPEYGSGFSKRQIELFRQFYRTFPIANTLYSQLSWSQYKLLLRLDTHDKREFYIAETIKNNWTVRQLERQIYSNLWERLLLSNDRQSVLAVARNEKQPSDAKEIIKDPMYLEFLGLKREASYYERDFHEVSGSRSFNVFDKHFKTFSRLLICYQSFFEKLQNQKGTQRRAWQCFPVIR